MHELQQVSQSKWSIASLSDTNCCCLVKYLLLTICNALYICNKSKGYDHYLRTANFLSRQGIMIDL